MFYIVYQVVELRRSFEIIILMIKLVLDLKIFIQIIIYESTPYCASNSILGLKQTT